MDMSRKEAITLPPRFVMVSSSLCLALAGAALLFAPVATLTALGMPAGEPLLAQILAAAYLGAAGTNWTARGSIIGGIYARPVSFGNFVHFAVGATTLAAGLRHGEHGPAYFAVLLLYCVFGAFFGVLLFNGPVVGRRRDQTNE